MSTFSSQNFKVGPCTVIFKDEVLGETTSSSVIKFRSNYHTFTNDQITGIPIIRQLKDINILFETELLAVDKGLDMLLDANGKITMEEINWMREPDYGELKLIPINPQDTTGYRFPRALLLRNSEVTIEGNDEHRIKLEFEAVYNENELMMEKIAVSDGDRINLNIPLSIDSVDFERAMTYYIADKLNMTVDTDIFRGKVPVNIDGCAVTLEGQDIKNSTINQKFEIKFICIDSNRDKVMKTVNDLTEKFPVYGENISLSGQDIGVKAILKDSSKFDWEITDDGKMKTLGSLTLLAII
jgi:hypothetical protein